MRTPTIVAARSPVVRPRRHPAWPDHSKARREQTRAPTRTFGISSTFVRHLAPAMWLVVAVMTGACQLGEEKYVRGRLEQLAGVEVVELRQHNTNAWRAPWWARLRLRDGTELLMLGLNAQSFDGAAEVRVGGVGVLTPWVASYGRHDNGVDALGRPTCSQSARSSLDLGPRGMLSSRLPLTFRNVTEALTDQAQLKAVLDAVPRCPEYDEFIDAEGTEHRYCLGHYPDGPRLPFAPHWSAVPGPCLSPGNTER